MDQKVPNRLRQTGSGRLPADEAARLPDRLLDAATAVFMKQGYAQTSMEGIAKLAGASTKTVYSRYRNKDEMLSAATARMLDRTLPKLTEELGREFDGEPQAVLTTIGERLATLAASPDALGLYRLVISETPRFPELARLYAQGSGRVVELLTVVFDQWDRTGRLPLSNKAEAVAGVFLDLVVATPRNKAVIGLPLDPPALRAHVAAAVDILLRGCGPHRAETR